MLPNNLNYSNNVEAAQSRSYKTNIQPTSGNVFKKGETAMFNIPTRNNLAMNSQDTYLRGTVSFKNGASASNFLRFDSNGVSAIIQKLNVYHGSNLLETIDNYKELSKFIFDTAVSTPQSNGKLSILGGTSTEYVGTTNAIASTAAGSIVPAVAAYTIPVKYINQGKRLNAYGAQIAANAITSYDFAIPLISVIGSLSPKYFPLFACKSAPVRVEITFVSDPLQCVCSDVALDSVDGINVSNLELVCSMMELSDQAINTIMSNGKLQYTFGDYRNYRTASNIPANVATNVSMAVPAKFASLKALYFMQKYASSYGINDTMPLPAEKNFLSSFQIRIGSQLLPPKAPSTTPEIFSELLKSIGSIFDLSHSPAIDSDSYTINQAATSNETVGAPSSINSPSFYVGLDCENYSGADKTSLFAGMYTANDDIFYNPVYDANGLGAAQTLIIDAFAYFDSVICFENDTCYVKF